jgi:uncharacterized protein (TIGR02001 family)
MTNIKMVRTLGVASLAACCLGTFAMPAYAQVSSTITVTSDYDFRGISQTARDPALQASLDFATESGFYLGAWASNADYGPGTDTDLELDLLGGFRGKFNDDTGYDIGLVWYTFQPGGDDVDYGELYAGLTYKMFSGKVYYSPDFNNFDESAYYIDTNLTFPLPNGFGLTIHAGYSDGDYWDVTNDDGYFDYSIGVTKTFGKFAFALKWIDGSDLEALKDAPDDIFTTESKVVLSVATTLPW